MGDGVWGNRDFRLVLVGGLVNNIGDWLLSVALPAYVYTETGSGRATAAIVIIELLVGIAFGAWGGSLVDRWDLRATVVATNLAQAVALLPLLAVTPDRLWPAFVVAGVQGLLQQVNDPASFALVPRIVPAEQLMQANAINSASGSIARLVGSPLGGIAVAVGGLSTVVVVDAITFLTVTVATSLVRRPAPLVTDEAAPGVGVREGWRAIRRHHRLVGYLAAQTLANLTFAMFPVLFIAFVVDVLDGDEATVGLIRGTAAFGGLAAAAIIGRRAGATTPMSLMRWGYLGLGAVAFVFVNVSLVTTAVWLFFALFALSGLPNMSSHIGATGTAQTLCPPELLGRLQGVGSALGAVGAITGSAAIAVLLDPVGVRPLLNVQAGLYVMCGVLTHLFVVHGRTLDPTDAGTTVGTAT